MIRTPVLAKLVLAMSAAFSLAACGGDDAPTWPPERAVIAHRGASALRPEHTLAAYQKAIDDGADIIEPDLVITKDGVLVARHENAIAILNADGSVREATTDVMDRPEFAARKTTKTIDGTAITGWFVEDFTLAELKTLRAIQPLSDRDQSYNGKFQIPTFEEVLDLAKTEGAKAGRTVGVYPETKHPTYHVNLGLKLEDRLLAVLAKYGYTSKVSPVIVQSFEVSNLKYLRTKTQLRLIQLVDGDDYDFKTGAVTFAPPFDRPYDWTRAGRKDLFGSMVTPDGLAEIAQYADGVGPWKPYIVPVKGTFGADGKMVDVNKDGVVNYADASSSAPTSLVADAHKLGLMVHTWTLRNENRRLAFDYQGDPKAEYLQFYRLGVDGLFSDFTDTAIAARKAYLTETGR